MDHFLKWELKTDHYEKIPLQPEGSPPNLRSFTRIKTKTNSWILVKWQSLSSKADSTLSDVINEYISKQRTFVAAGTRTAAIKAIDKKKGLLLLEDLGDINLEKEYIKNPSQALQYYQQAVDQMVNLQEYRVEWPRFSNTDLFREMLWTKEHLTDQLLTFQWKKLFLGKCFNEWQQLCQSLENFHYRPTHRDYHSRNLMIKNSKVYLIDFQDAKLFPRCYDLVSLLYDPYVNLDISFQKQIIEYLVLQRACSKQAIEKELFITAVQRLFKACGSFASFYSIRKQKTHLPYIVPSLKILEHLLKQIQIYPCFLQLVRDLLKNHRGQILNL